MNGAATCGVACTSPEVPPAAAAATAVVTLAEVLAMAALGPRDRPGCGTACDGRVAATTTLLSERAGGCTCGGMLVAAGVADTTSLCQELCGPAMGPALATTRAGRGAAGLDGPDGEVGTSRTSRSRDTPTVASSRCQDRIARWQPERRAPWKRARCVGTARRWAVDGVGRTTAPVYGGRDERDRLA